MDLPAILLSSLWAALYATGLGVLLTAPVGISSPLFSVDLSGVACETSAWGGA